MLEKVSSLNVGVEVGVAVGVGVGVGDCVVVGVGVGVGNGVGVGLGVGVGIAFIGVPLLQIKRLPDFIQVNLKLLSVFVKPCFAHCAPGFGALAKATGNI